MKHITTNVDLRKLTPQQILAGEREERNLAAFEQAMDQPDYQFQGLYAPGKQNLVSTTQVNWSLSDVIRRKHSGEKIIPVMYHKESGVWILADEDREAVLSGYVCENCLEWQDIPNHRVCNSVTGFSCGYSPR